MHDVIELITCSVICHESPKGLIVNNMRVEWRGEHDIQPSLDRAWWSSICEGPCLLLPWWLRGPLRLFVVDEGPRRASKVFVISGFPSMSST